MSTTQPIRDREKLEQFRNYYRFKEPNRRNYLLIVTTMNTALRISDVLKLRWTDLYDFDEDRFQEHINITETKTHKKQTIAINSNIKDAVASCLKIHSPWHGDFVFKGYGPGPMSRTTAWRIVKKAAVESGMPEHISPHSLRKTFGYFAWKRGIQPAVIMSIYNHSSYAITKRYLGIEQDDKDEIYQQNEL